MSSGAASANACPVTGLAGRGDLDVDKWSLVETVEPSTEDTDYSASRPPR